MKKSTLQSLYKEALIKRIWLWCSMGFVLVYSMLVIKTFLGIGLNKRVLHVLSCLCLLVTYGSCVFFRTNAINLQKLLKDGNFRCLLVAGSFLGMNSALIPMFPFMLMTTLSVAEQVVKERKKFAKTSLLDASLRLTSRRDEVTLFALKVEVISVPLLVLHLLTGNADMFSVVSYASMAWFEYGSNPCMQRAVRELVGSLDRIIGTPGVPPLVQSKYGQLKRYVAAYSPAVPAAGSEPAKAKAS
ncbi:hypothetical protein NEHOM01_0034 [Nematocida homosporus]|uniref:uncharacterized protein n=1 Tax=Nematocida homosporus TaxID=1912981 RepID=UPI00221F99C5|nr:uncharacterized protein NEHOM01_0034 [Nematocida homosporus]KAI5184289.1 hypothetical protein NEHOM01_0034 [Nematocida homosporus]